MNTEFMYVCKGLKQMTKGIYQVLATALLVVACCILAWQTRIGYLILKNFFDYAKEYFVAYPLFAAYGLFFGAVIGRYSGGSWKSGGIIGLWILPLSIQVIQLLFSFRTDSIIAYVAYAAIGGLLGIVFAKLSRGSGKRGAISGLCLLPTALASIQFLCIVYRAIAYPLG
jgi:hypothetical protein